MNIEEIRNYCIIKKNATESQPFGKDILVYKTNNKIFLILFLQKFPLFFNVKTNPEWSEELRENYSEITEGYHMSKNPWTSVYYEELPYHLILKLIDHSYDLVSK